MPAASSQKPAAEPDGTLTALADAYGVATEYEDWSGRAVQVGDATLRAVLTALGARVEDAEQTRASLDERRLHLWRRAVPAVTVVRDGTPAAEEPAIVWVRLPEQASAQAELVLEDGSVVDLGSIAPADTDADEPSAAGDEEREEPGENDTGANEAGHEAAMVEDADRIELDGVPMARRRVELPPGLPLGYHRLTVTVDDEDGPAQGEVIFVPERLELPAELVDHPVWGLTTQLYSVRSEQSWGLGDIADLAEMGSWSSRQGADFVLINPLHAAEPVPTMEPSPYLPVTRRFVNPMYIRVEEVPEMGYLSSAEHQMIEWHGDDARRLNGLGDLDRDGSWEAKQAALRIVFRQRRTHRRRRDFEEFCAREGQGLIDYATWCAFVVEFGLDAAQWPAGLDDPRSEETAQERRRLADEVEFHSWMQWIVQQQLADCQRELRAAGMAVGVVHDLAVGVHGGGSDVWSLGDVLATGVTVGAPPDDYNASGQDWSQPPWRPDRLEETGYQAYRDMLRSILRVSGGLRIDHILGLFRLWWVPRGEKATQGTYVRYDHEAMLGILTLEAHRADALVIGEDLGTVEPWVRDELTGRGLLGTSILWFERQDGGVPRPPEDYRELCLASVTTHDLPPTAGYLQGEHIKVRSELGLLPGSLEEEMKNDAAQRDQVLAELRRRGLLGEGAGIEEQVVALYRFLALSPSRLLGVALPDLVGDVRTINQPGTDEEYPNWRLPLADASGAPLMLEDVMVSRRAKRLLRAVNSTD